MTHLLVHEYGMVQEEVNSSIAGTFAFMPLLGGMVGPLITGAPDFKPVGHMASSTESSLLHVRVPE